MLSHAAVDELRGLAAGVLESALDASDLASAQGMGTDLDGRLTALRNAALALTREVGLAAEDPGR